MHLSKVIVLLLVSAISQLPSDSACGQLNSDPQMEAYAQSLQKCYDELLEGDTQKATALLAEISKDHAPRSGWEIDLLREAIRSVKEAGKVSFEVPPGIRIGPKAKPNQTAPVLNPIKGELVFASETGTLRIAQLKGGEKIVKDPWGVGVSAARYSTNGDYCVSGNTRGQLTVWNAKDWKVIAKIDPSKSHQMDLGIEDPEKEKDRARAAVLRKIEVESPGARVTAVDISDDGQRIVFNCGIEALLWDVQSEKLIANLSRMGLIVRGPILLSDDDSLIAVGGERDIKIYDGKTGQHINNIQQDYYPREFAFSPNNNLIASGTRGYRNAKRMDVYEVKSSKKVFEIPTLESYIGSVQFLPDSQRIVCSDGYQMYVYHVPSNIKLLDMPVGQTVGAMDISSDGKILKWIRRVPEEGWQTEYFDLNR